MSMREGEEHRNDEDATSLRPSGCCPDWDALARLPGWAGVIDPADQRGAKNRLIDLVHKQALGHHVGELQGQRVLDYGCGVGRLSSWLVDRGAIVVGTDRSTEMIQRARSTISNASFVEMTGDRLPDDIGGDFAVVLTVGVLQYVANDLRRLTSSLTALRGTLSPEGIVVAVEQVHDGDRYPGTSVGGYETAFANAGLRLTSMCMIRQSDSVVVSSVTRWPWCASLPGLPWLVRAEARCRTGNLSGGGYADCLFRARAETVE